MADGVVLNEGTGGETAATDDCGAAGHAQIIKLAISTDGDATLIPAEATNGLDVDVTRSALPTGAATSAKQDTIIGHVDGIEGLLTTIDSDTGALAACASGSELQVDIVSGTVAVTHAALTELGSAIDTEVQCDIVGALPAGNNNIGDVDVASLPALAAGTNAIGKLLPPDTDVTAHTNYAKKYYTNAGAVTDGIIWSPAAGKRWHVVSMFINVSADATVTLEDDKSGGDEAIMKMELAGKSGFTVNFGEKYPLASGEDAADLTITTSAGNVYVTVTGYEV